ncbi:MAG: aminotransferase class V-fold PLP-dependent enzyme [Bacteroidota bacterium]
MLACQRHHFRLPPEVAYLNCAYMSPLMERVAAAGRTGVDRKFRPDLLTPNDFFDEVHRVKKLFARLVETDDPERSALLPSVSYGLAIAANNTPIAAGQKVLLLAEQFPSNYYCWERVTKEKGAELELISAPSSDAQRAAKWNQNLLAAIDQRTAAVSIGHVHWADGSLFDLPAIRARTREVGALLIIDGTQSIGALPFSVRELGVDALVCGTYKWLFGPYGMALAYFGPAFDGGRPLEENWINRRDSHHFERLVPYTDHYLPAAGRYSVGQQSNFITVPMAISSLQQLLEWKVSCIQEYAAQLQAPYLERLQALGARIEAPEARSAHLFGVRLRSDQVDAEKLGAARKKHGVHLSQRGDSIRVSVSVFNEAQDFERLLRCFEAAQH